MLYNLCSPIWTCFHCSCCCSGCVSVHGVICREAVVFSESRVRSLQVSCQYSGGNSWLTHGAHSMFSFALTSVCREESLMSFLVFSGCLLTFLFIQFFVCMFGASEYNTRGDLSLSLFFLLITMDDYNALVDRKECQARLLVSINGMPTTTSTWINPIKSSLIS